MEGADAEIFAALGWGDDFDADWRDLGSSGRPGRVSRVDRNWSTLLVPDATVIDDDARRRVGHHRLRNLHETVAVGDWVVASDDGERVEHVLERRSAFVRRASFEGSRAVADVLAANLDTVFLTHSMGSAPNQ